MNDPRLDEILKNMGLKKSTQSDQPNKVGEQPKQISIPLGEQSYLTLYQQKREKPDETVTGIMFTYFF